MERTALKGNLEHRQHRSPVPDMEPARIGYHKIVSDILRRAPAADAARIAWQLVAGSQVAERTSVVDLSDGVLTVQVPDTAWRAELLGFASQYLAALNKLLTGGVHRIEFLAPDKKSAQRA